MRARKAARPGGIPRSEIDDVTPGVGGHLACFEKHRGTFERVADIKHQRGVREQSGAVTLQAGDLKTFS